MKLCIDCRFILDNNYCVRESVLNYEKDEPKKDELSPVDGKPIVYAKSYLLDRSAFVERTSGRCGMDAKFFEIKKQ